MKTDDTIQIISEYMSKPFTYGDVMIHRADVCEKYDCWKSLTDEQMFIMAKCIHDIYHWYETREFNVSMNYVSKYVDFTCRRYWSEKDGVEISGDEESAKSWVKEHVGMLENMISWNCVEILEELGVIDDMERNQNNPFRHTQIIIKNK